MSFIPAPGRKQEDLEVKAILNNIPSKCQSGPHKTISELKKLTSQIQEKVQQWRRALVQSTLGC